MERKFSAECCGRIQQKGHYRICDNGPLVLNGRLNCLTGYTIPCTYGYHWQTRLKHWSHYCNVCCKGRETRDMRWSGAVNTMRNRPCFCHHHGS